MSLICDHIQQCIARGRQQAGDVVIDCYHGLDHEKDPGFHCGSRTCEFVRADVRCEVIKCLPTRK